MLGLSLASIVATMLTTIGLAFCRQRRLFHNLNCAFYVTSAIALIGTVAMFGFSYNELEYKPFGSIHQDGDYELGWAFYLTLTSCILMFVSATIMVMRTLQQQREYYRNLNKKQQKMNSQLGRQPDRIMTGSMHKNVPLEDDVVFLDHEVKHF